MEDGNRNKNKINRSVARKNVEANENEIDTCTGKMWEDKYKLLERVSVLFDKIIARPQ